MVTRIGGLWTQRGSRLRPALGRHLGRVGWGGVGWGGVGWPAPQEAVYNGVQPHLPVASSRQLEELAGRTNYPCVTTTLIAGLVTGLKRERSNDTTHETR